MGTASPFEFLARRRFLKWSLGVSGLVLGGGSAAYLSYFRLAPRVRGLRALSDAQHQTLRGLVTTICGPAAERERTHVADAFDAFLADEPPHIRSDLTAALTWIELGPGLYDRRWRSFSELTQREREVHFESWMHSDDPTRRKVATAFRKFVNLVCYDMVGTWGRIHYPGPVTGLREDDEPAGGRR
ncbi:MAG TPA: hypothetical protein ENK57_16755 [Polyangiaceae bacterium]|nr:hypothetical protein [Polyangiaceae bacterium]